MRALRLLVLGPLILVACSQAVPGPTPPLSVAGTWQGLTGYGSGVRLVLTQNGAAIGGVFYTSSQQTPTVFRRWGPLTGVLSGTRLSLDATGDPGEFAGAVARFTGEVQGDQYVGDLTTTSGSNTDTVHFEASHSGAAGQGLASIQASLSKETPTRH